MRILQLVTRRQRRGAEVFATQLSDALAARGHDVLVMGLFPPPLDPLDPSAAAADDIVDGSDGRFDLRRLRGVADAIRRVAPDVVQANGSQTLKYSTIARRILPGRVPLVYRNISVASQWVRSPAHRAWGRWLASGLDHVTSVSEESSRDFGETYRVPPERRSVIRRGVPMPDGLDPAAAKARLVIEAGIPADAPVLAHVGNYSEEKNHAWLVDTFRRIHDARPDARLVLIGDGPLRPAVETLVRELGLREAVRILGMRPDAADLVGGADLFVLPSRIEGIPGVVLEAGARGVPAVATRVGGMAEAIVDGRTGRLVESGDRDGFIAATLALLDDHPARRAMGDAARALVAERFSMDATVAAFEALYARLAAPREGRRPVG